MPTYTPDTIVEVLPFTRQHEGEDVIIGRVETGTFLAVPPPAVDVLDYLGQGKSIGEAADLFQKKYGTVPDMQDFLQNLESNGFIRQYGDEDAGAETKSPAPIRYHFSNFPQSVAQRIFSWPVVAGCCTMVAAAIGLMIRDPSLVPRPRDAFFKEHRTISLTLLVLVSYGSVIVHEFAHVIAARSKGINSRLGIGHRLWDFVVEADLSGLWSLPKRDRYLPLFAGSLHDSVMASIVVFVLFANGQKWLMLSAFTFHIVRAVLLIFVTRVLWQCLVFTRTDYYYVLASLLNCRNLLGDTQDYLRNQIARLIPKIRPVDQSRIPMFERRVIPAFAVVWVAGRILAWIVFFSITVPFGILYIQNLIRAVKVGFSVNPRDFMDSVLLCLYLVLPFAIGIPLWFATMARGLRRVIVESQGA